MHTYFPDHIAQEAPRHADGPAPSRESDVAAIFSDMMAAVRGRVSSEHPVSSADGASGAAPAEDATMGPPEADAPPASASTAPQTDVAPNADEIPSGYARVRQVTDRILSSDIGHAAPESLQQRGGADPERVYGASEPAADAAEAADHILKALLDGRATVERIPPADGPAESNRTMPPGDDVHSGRSSRSHRDVQPPFPVVAGSTAEGAPDEAAHVDNRMLPPEKPAGAEGDTEAETTRPFHVIAARRGVNLTADSADATGHPVPTEESTDVVAARDTSRSDDGESSSRRERLGRAVSEAAPPTGASPASPDVPAGIDTAVASVVYELQTENTGSAAGDSVAPEGRDVTLTDSSRVISTASDRSVTSPQAAPRGAMQAAWLRAMMDQGFRLDTTADGWSSLTVRLGEREGTMKVDARRDDDRMAIRVVFSDPQLRALAVQEVDRLEAALQSHYQTSVDLSLGSDGSPGGAAQHRAAHAGGSASSPDTLTHTPYRPVRAAAQGATREWIG